eukprot:jgi/Botrbrau1/9231/Bobra.0028s0026.1
MHDSPVSQGHIEGFEALSTSREFQTAHAAGTSPPQVPHSILAIAAWTMKDIGAATPGTDMKQGPSRPRANASSLESVPLNGIENPPPAEHKADIRRAGLQDGVLSPSAAPSTVRKGRHVPRWQPLLHSLAGPASVHAAALESQSLARTPPRHNTHGVGSLDLLLTLSLPTTPESGLTGQIETACRGLDSLVTTASPDVTEVTPTPIKDLLRACRSRSPPVFPWMQSNPMFEELLPQDPEPHPQGAPADPSMHSNPTYTPPGRQSTAGYPSMASPRQEAALPRDQMRTANETREQTLNQSQPQPPISSENQRRRSSDPGSTSSHQGDARLPLTEISASAMNSSAGLQASIGPLKPTEEAKSPSAPDTETDSALDGGGQPQDFLPTNRPQYRAGARSSGEPVVGRVSNEAAPLRPSQRFDMDPNPHGGQALPEGRPGHVILESRSEVQVAGGGQLEADAPASKPGGKALGGKMGANGEVSSPDVFGAKKAPSNRAGPQAAEGTWLGRQDGSRATGGPIGWTALWDTASNNSGLDAVPDSDQKLSGWRDSTSRVPPTPSGTTALDGVPDSQEKLSGWSDTYPGPFSASSSAPPPQPSPCFSSAFGPTPSPLDITHSGSVSYFGIPPTPPGPHAMQCSFDGRPASRDLHKPLCSRPVSYAPHVADFGALHTHAWSAGSSNTPPCPEGPHSTPYTGHPDASPLNPADAPAFAPSPIQNGTPRGQNGNPPVGSTAGASCPDLSRHEHPTTPEHPTTVASLGSGELPSGGRLHIPSVVAPSESAPGVAAEGALPVDARLPNSSGERRSTGAPSPLKPDPPLQTLSLPSAATGGRAGRLGSPGQPRHPSSSSDGASSLDRTLTGLSVLSPTGIVEQGSPTFTCTGPRATQSAPAAPPLGAFTDLFFLGISPDTPARRPLGAPIPPARATVPPARATVPQKDYDQQIEMEHNHGLLNPREPALYDLGGMAGGPRTDPGLNAALNSCCVFHSVRLHRPLEHRNVGFASEGEAGGAVIPGCEGVAISGYEGERGDAATMEDQAYLLHSNWQRPSSLRAGASGPVQSSPSSPHIRTMQDAGFVENAWHWDGNPLPYDANLEAKEELEDSLAALRSAAWGFPDGGADPRLDSRDNGQLRAESERTPSPAGRLHSSAQHDVILSESEQKELLLALKEEAQYEAGFLPLPQVGPSPSASLSRHSGGASDSTSSWEEASQLPSPEFGASPAPVSLPGRGGPQDLQHSPPRGIQARHAQPRQGAPGDLPLTSGELLQFGPSGPACEAGPGGNFPRSGGGSEDAGMPGPLALGRAVARQQTAEASSPKQPSGLPPSCSVRMSLPGPLETGRWGSAGLSHGSPGVPPSASARERQSTTSGALLRSSCPAVPSAVPSSGGIHAEPPMEPLAGPLLLQEGTELPLPTHAHLGQPLRGAPANWCMAPSHVAMVQSSQSQSSMDGLNAAVDSAQLPATLGGSSEGSGGSGGANANRFLENLPGGHAHPLATKRGRPESTVGTSLKLSPIEEAPAALTRATASHSRGCDEAWDPQHSDVLALNTSTGEIVPAEPDTMRVSLPSKEAIRPGPANGPLNPAIASQLARMEALLRTGYRGRLPEHSNTYTGQAGLPSLETFLEEDVAGRNRNGDLPLSIDVQLAGVEAYMQHPALWGHAEVVESVLLDSEADALGLIRSDSLSLDPLRPYDQAERARSRVARRLFELGGPLGASMEVLRHSEAVWISQQEMLRASGALSRSCQSGANSESGHGHLSPASLPDASMHQERTQPLTSGTGEEAANTGKRRFLSRLASRMAWGRSCQSPKAISDVPFREVEVQGPSKPKSKFARALLFLRRRSSSTAS